MTSDELCRKGTESEPEPSRPTRPDAASIAVPARMKLWCTRIRVSHTRIRERCSRCSGYSGYTALYDTSVSSGSARCVSGRRQSLRHPIRTPLPALRPSRFPLTGSGDARHSSAPTMFTQHPLRKPARKKDANAEPRSGAYQMIRRHTDAVAHPNALLPDASGRPVAPPLRARSPDRFDAASVQRAIIYITVVV